MQRLILMSFLMFSFQATAMTLAGKYELKNSKINYLVKYLVKKADGDSSSAKGKGECNVDICNFLIAVPMKSFVSKDSNRDINMLNTTKAEKFPLVIAKLRAPKEAKNNELIADVEIEFSGIKKEYKNISFKLNETADGFHADGNFDLILDDFKIEKPSLLGVDIESLVPITITADWKKAI